MMPRSLVLTWVVLGGAMVALFVFQWTHPGGGSGESVPRVAGPSPAVSSSIGPAPVTAGPQPSGSPGAAVARGPIPARTTSLVPSAAAAFASAAGTASQTANPSPVPSPPTPRPPLTAAITVVAPLPRNGHLTVKAALVIPAAPPWPGLDIELPR